MPKTKVKNLIALAYPKPKLLNWETQEKATGESPVALSSIVRLMTNIGIEWV
ncbi:hypothetical protein [Halobacillus amylolyticus]|uniref:Uncharacterized protein n=1 Tax=Halobacillus amylolyticus TaxID=2932259 RepID=A0ABY4HH11_9BACI|nr:hypothetical protein [Halobacillus amylolyticus]UOR14201.1 hypothetical protein MUO15_20900 [Halobacillus amylolyticus]